MMSAALFPLLAWPIRPSSVPYPEYLRPPSSPSAANVAFEGGDWALFGFPLLILSTVRG